jgi:hypothetical protein
MAAKKRGRPAKSALNQKKEVNVSVSEKDVEKVEELHNIDLVEEAKEMASEEFNVPEENVVVEITPEEPEVEEVVSEEPEQPIEPEEEEEAPKQRTLADLSTAELRNYYRTGKMPQ